MPTPEGLIPAHAGKTSDTSSARTKTPAHPRSRGENLTLGMSDSVDKGSSPLTRGKHGLLSVSARRPRLIPAHAGKTRVIAARSVMRAAHPRSRGENP